MLKIANNALKSQPTPQFRFAPNAFKDGDRLEKCTDLIKRIKELEGVIANLRFDTKSIPYDAAIGASSTSVLNILYTLGDWFNDPSSEKKKKAYEEACKKQNIPKAKADELGKVLLDCTEGANNAPNDTVLERFLSSIPRMLISGAVGAAFASFFKNMNKLRIAKKELKTLRDDLERCRKPPQQRERAKEESRVRAKTPDQESYEPKEQIRTPVADVPDGYWDQVDQNNYPQPITEPQTQQQKRQAPVYCFGKNQIKYQCGGTDDRGVGGVIVMGMLVVALAAGGIAIMAAGSAALASALAAGGRILGPAALGATAAMASTPSTTDRYKYKTVLRNGVTQLYVPNFGYARKKEKVDLFSYNYSDNTVGTTSGVDVFELEDGRRIIFSPAQNEQDHKKFQMSKFYTRDGKNYKILSVSLASDSYLDFSRAVFSADTEAPPKF